MANHPNFDRAQAALAAARQGDYAPSFDAFADDILVENGPGAGPWHRARSKDDLALLLLEFAASFGDTFHQDGRCVYADDRVAISLIHETGTAPGGDQFDNLAVYITRLRPDGQTDRMWTVDLDAEHCEAFWQKNPGTPSKDFS
jgi:ketosteroid isomerase-like protein